VTGTKATKTPGTHCSLYTIDTGALKRDLTIFMIYLKLGKIYPGFKLTLVQFIYIKFIKHLQGLKLKGIIK
jgi:hypothetical protein